MKERPILFSGPMVRAILDGRKTQTRRVIKPQPERSHWERDEKHELLVNTLYSSAGYCVRFQHILKGINREDPQWRTSPYGAPGDRLWVRETFALHHSFPDEVFYRADKEISGQKWTPSIFMPRWASRITLRITDIRVERLQDISDRGPQNDCTDEGVFFSGMELPAYEEWSGRGFHSCEKCMFRDLWDAINSKRPGCSWDDNPWVWVVEFEKIE